MNRTALLIHILEKSSMYLLILNPKGVIQEFHCGTTSSLGWNDSWIGNSLQNYVLDTCKDLLHEIIESVGNGETLQNQQLQFPTKSSKGIVSLRLDFSLVDGFIYATGIDVTEENKEHQALSAVSKLGKIAAWYYNPVTKELFWSKECYKMHGIDPDDTERDQKGFYNYEEAIRERAKEYLYKLLETKEPYAYIETVTQKEGVTYLHITAEPVLHNGNVVFVNGTVANITERQEYLQKLEYSEETKRLALKGIRSGLFDHDIETNLVYYSPSFKRMLGLSIKDDFVPEETFRKMIHPDDVDEALQRHLDNLDKETAYYFNHYRLRHLDGQYRYYEVYGFCKKNESGTTERLIGNLIDVNERKLNEQMVLTNQRRMRAMINNGFVYTFLLDTEGKILLTDEASAAIIEQDFGVNPLETTVQFIKVLPLNFKHTFADSFNEALKGTITRKEIERVLHQGNSQWLEIKYTPITNELEEVTSVLITGLDITERKIADIAIKEAHIKEQELHSLKTNILANFSHEIRTPLNGIMAISDLLLTEKDEEERANLMVYLKESKDRLLETLNNLSEFSELEAIRANLDCSEHDLNFTVESSFREYDHLAELKSLAYNLVLDNTSPKVIIDEQLFRTALNNIIHNAIKYTPTGNITITIASDATNNKATVSVKDSGIGIAKENLHKIFDPFVQESIGMSRKYEGTGIGLSLSKRYIEILKGSITVQSEVGKGSEFIITLPIKQ
ncbi:PAS domain S-box-containing protein [Kordia periserrulae]|uniref:histidine kinase n=1 Tax=Kordia periserrulae TaxID=701523 RepID=A0A2T6C229_9FLAO|nr:PAS domain-containing sensor histidine kinase [Kordia periserrulae]PTX62370.1 PAS domain S-box-containing protein [Kordia periserrulae]